MSGTVEIVVAAMTADGAGRVLVAERPAGKFMAGWWEFPGGKLEWGERPEDGLRRELREELNMEIEVGDPFHAENVVRGDGKAILVLFYWCRWTGGAIELLDAGAVRWVTIDGFDEIRFLESNRPVVDKLRARGIPGA